MDDNSEIDTICRLCCTSNSVNNCIFSSDDELYYKIATYMPIKILKDDNLPQKICDICFGKVNEFYEFCNNAIEMQTCLNNFLYAKLKNNGTQLVLPKRECRTLTVKCYECKETQTDYQINVKSVDTINFNVQHVKLEEVDEIFSRDAKFENGLADESSDGDDIALSSLKKKKKKKKKQKVNIRKRRKKEINFSDLLSITTKDIEINCAPNPPQVEVKEEICSDTDLSNAEVKSEPIYDDTWYCCICYIKCSNKTELITHYRSHADKSSEISGSIENHIEINDKDAKKYLCKKCKHSCRTKDGIIKHIKVHLNIRPFRCSVCERSFKDVVPLLKHGQRHTFTTQGENDPVAPEKMEKQYICDLCDDKFVYTRNLLEHRSMAHSDSTRKFAHRCIHCRRDFTHLNSLRRHLRSHTGERNFLCSVCGKALSSKEHLKFHLRIHTGYKPNICKTCGKGFAKKCNLILHERVHSGEKPHVCSQCGKAFSQRSTLVIHERYHSGARPYVCSMCGKGFVARGLLSMHLKTTCVN